MISKASSKNKLKIFKPLHEVHSQRKQKIIRRIFPLQLKHCGKPQRKRDLNTISIVKGNQKYRESFEIRRAFSKVFPMKQLVVAFNTARGNIHIEFWASQEADEVFSDWKSEYLGPKTNKRKASSGN